MHTAGRRAHCRSLPARIRRAHRRAPGHHLARGLLRLRSLRGPGARPPGNRRPRRRPLCHPHSLVLPGNVGRHHHAVYGKSARARLSAAQLHNRPAPHGARPHGRKQLQVHRRHGQHPQHHHHRRACQVQQVRDTVVHAQAPHARATRPSRWSPPTTFRWQRQP